MECYVFETEAEAIAAEAAISQIAGCPLVGSKNGQANPDAQKTERWSDINQRPDGKWWFPRVPDSRIAAMGIALEQVQYFRDNFTYIIENFDPSWQLDI